MPAGSQQAAMYSTPRCREQVGGLRAGLLGCRAWAACRARPCMSGLPAGAALQACPEPRPCPCAHLAACSVRAAVAIRQRRGLGPLQDKQHRRPAARKLRCSLQYQRRGEQSGQGAAEAAGWRLGTQAQRLVGRPLHSACSPLVGLPCLPRLPRLACFAAATPALPPPPALLQTRPERCTAPRGEWVLVPFSAAVQGYACN